VCIDVQFYVPFHRFGLNRVMISVKLCEIFTDHSETVSEQEMLM